MPFLIPYSASEYTLPQWSELPTLDIIHLHEKYHSLQPLFYLSSGTGRLQAEPQQVGRGAGSKQHYREGRLYRVGHEFLITLKSLYSAVSKSNVFHTVWESHSELQCCQDIKRVFITPLHFSPLPISRHHYFSFSHTGVKQ